MTTAELLLLGIVTFILIDFAAGRVIDYLNESNKDKPLSPVAAEIYNPDEYAKSLEYGTAKYKVELFTAVVSTVVMLSAIILGWFAWLDQQIRDRFDNQLLITVIFIGVLILVSMIGALPSGYYSTFVVEEKFGFNKTTLDEIGDSIGFNKAALYYYFKNKEELFVQVVNNQLTKGLDKLQSDIVDMPDDETKILKYLWNRTQVYTNLVKLTSLSNENILDLNNTFEEIYGPYKKLEINFLKGILSKTNKNKSQAEHDNFAELILDLVNAIGLSALLVRNITNQSQFLEQYNIKKESIVKLMLKAYHI